MNDRNDHLIASLVDELRPVRPMKWRNGGFLVLASLGATVAAAWALYGLRPNLTAGAVAPLFVIANGLLLLLGMCSAAAVISMAMPRVGSQHEAPKWAMATVALLPLAAIVAGLAGGSSAELLSANEHDIACLIRGSAFAALVAGTLFYWLRHGAPVSLERAGLYLGAAAGSLGMFAYGLSCPLESIAHLGIWHVLPVVLTSLLGFMTVPRLLRW